MPTDRISLTLPAAKLTAVDNALSALESALTDLVALEPAQRRRLPRMGGKSEAFCRQTLSVVAQNPQVVNPSLGLPAAQADLAALDQLRPRRQRLQKLQERMMDTETLLGSDVMSTALEAYGLLKISGKSQGLSALRAGLSSRFKRAALNGSLKASRAGKAANDPDGNAGQSGNNAA